MKTESSHFLHMSTQHEGGGLPPSEGCFWEFTEGLHLSLKYFSDGLNSVAGLELGREWMSDEIYLRLDFVLFQSRFEK